MSSIDEVQRMEEGQSIPQSETGFCSNPSTVLLIQKIIAEAIGTYFLVFAGCLSVVLNKMDGSVTFPGICMVWGLSGMVMIYAVGHISGAHFNPAITLTFAIVRQFSLKQVPLYIIAQVIGSILASGTLYLLFEVDENLYFGTAPSGSKPQSLVIEIIASFLLMFVCSAVATDDRAIGQLAGIAIGMTLTVDLFMAGRVSGGSMNPARSIGPAIIMNNYDSIWIYMVGPFCGALLGGFAYGLIRYTDKPLKELRKAPAHLFSHNTHPPQP